MIGKPLPPQSGVQCELQMAADTGQLPVVREPTDCRSLTTFFAYRGAIDLTMNPGLAGMRPRVHPTRRRSIRLTAAVASGVGGD